MSSTSSIKIEGPESDKVVIAFAGLGGKSDGIPQFEFVRTFEGKGFQRVFVRDPRQCWYHYGTGESSIPELRAELRRICDSKSIYAIGCSAGGYAAILFGHLLEAKLVLAFSPQTTINRGQKAALKDSRYGYVHKLLPKTARRFQDLKRHLDEWNGVTRYEIHIGDAGVDGRHADRIWGCEGVEVFKYPFGGHHVARALKQRGMLHDIITERIG